MRKLGVEEWLVSAVMSMYAGAKTVVRTVYGNSSGFEVKVGMHQGSALSQLLFVIFMEVISREFRVGLPWELLYADDLVVMGNGRFPDNHLSGQTFPGQDVSRKDVSRTTACPNSSIISRTRRFPDIHFPGETFAGQTFPRQFV